MRSHGSAIRHQDMNDAQMQIIGVESEDSIPRRKLASINEISEGSREKSPDSPKNRLRNSARSEHKREYPPARTRHPSGLAGANGMPKTGTKYLRVKKLKPRGSADVPRKEVSGGSLVNDGDCSTVLLNDSGLPQLVEDNGLGSNSFSSSLGLHSTLDLTHYDFAIAELKSSKQDVHALEMELDIWVVKFETLQKEHTTLQSEFQVLKRNRDDLQALCGGGVTPVNDAMYDKNGKNMRLKKLRTKTASRGAFDLRSAWTTVHLRSAWTTGQAYLPSTPKLRENHHARLKNVLSSQRWKVVSISALFLALFGGHLATLFDIPDDPANDVLVALMLIIMVIFLFELVATWLVFKSYRFSFFFWMDFAGTLSMVSEISYLLPGGALFDVNVAVLRTARAAKMGARLGRLGAFLQRVLFKDEANDTIGKPKAKTLSHLLKMRLSTSISMLTLLLIMLLPLFQIPLYPTTDLSMKLWSQRLEEIYRWEFETVPTDIFATSLLHLDHFYNDETYQPYKIEGFSPELYIQGVKKTLGGMHQLDEKAPNRRANIREALVTDCRLSRAACSSEEKAKIFFDFTTPNQHEAVMGILLIVFMISIMVIMVYEVNRKVEELVMAPIQRMIAIARGHAAILLNQISAPADSKDECDDVQPASELEMLEALMSKMVRLVELNMRKNVVDEKDVKKMDKSGLAIMDMMQVKVVDRNKVFAPTALAEFSAKSRLSLMMSWEIDPLNMSVAQQNDLVSQVFFTSNVGTALDFVEQSTFVAFHNVVQAGYNDLPYHSYTHAVDVLQAVFKMLALVQCDTWMTPMESYALLVAALCHDVGHFGKTNPFLVETQHELALRYNDASPLENMHVATLFQVCSDPLTDAFAKASAEARKDARKVCITSILHTDNAKHFATVKNISQCYEMNREVCDNQAGQEDFSSTYNSLVLQKDKQMWFDLFLHLADVSNPFKPFEASKAWAWCVLDEFFDQGDEEKKLGIPIGMLNDRDKVDRPGSQHGFINFLVAPLVINSVRIFPPFQEFLGQLSSNLKTWRDVWIKEGTPLPEEIRKKDEDVQKLREVTQILRDRARRRKSASSGKRLWQDGASLVTADSVGHQGSIGIHSLANRISMNSTASSKSI